jgi:hypothetical protein
MAIQVLQRPDSHGTPIEMGDLFRLQKNRREARAALFTDQLGWEVRLLIGPSSKSFSRKSAAIRRGANEGEQWKKAMNREGVALSR